MNLIPEPYDSSIDIIQMKDATRTKITEAGVDTSYGKKDCNGFRTDIDMNEFGVTILSNGLITWSNNSPDHPRNWPLARKFYDIGVVATMEFFT